MKFSPSSRQTAAASLQILLVGLALGLFVGCASSTKAPEAEQGSSAVGNPLPPVYQTPNPVPVPAPPTPAPSPNPLPTPSSRLMLGIDVLASRNFDVLQGQRVGLLTHLAGVNRDGVSTTDILRHAPGVNLVALFAPEHGLYGNIAAGAEVDDRVDARTGLMVYSLFGKDRYPTTEMLQKIDVMVVDLQDLGTRSYTFISCLRYTMEKCFEEGKTVVVLDRPNPLGGLKVGGPMIDEDLMSYIGAYRIPYVFGLTIGELAQISKDTPGWLKISESERQRGRLIVIPMRGWRRSMLWPDTGMKWIPTSPYIPDVASAFGYSLTGLGGLLGKMDHGVGSPYPFRLLNFPGHKPEEVAAVLRTKNLAGLDFVPVTFDDKKKSGVYVQITNWNAVEPTRLAFEMMKLSVQWSSTTTGNPFVKASGPDAHSFNIAVGSNDWWKEIATKGPKADVDRFFRQWDAQDAAFQQWSKRWWLYPE